MINEKGTMEVACTRCGIRAEDYSEGLFAAQPCRSDLSAATPAQAGTKNQAPSTNLDLPMTSEEKAVWAIIEPRRGKGCEILGEAIAERLGMNYKRVRQVIAHLVNVHAKLIGSNSSGYYVAVTHDEVNEITLSLRHRGIMILLRASRLQKTSLVEVWKQSYLEFGDNINAAH
jgi:hypothetical protein